jgi:hypothetical protein
MHLWMLQHFLHKHKGFFVVGGKKVKILVLHKINARE